MNEKSAKTLPTLPGTLGLIRRDLVFYAGKARLINLLYTYLFNPAFQLCLLYRISHHCARRKLSALAGIAQWLETILFSCQIESRAKIGARLKFAHPLGIVIGIAEIGDDVTIWQNVTIGASGKTDERGRYPVIGNNVKIFTHAVLIGGISIGTNAVIGALSLVNSDVPENSVAVGIPARVVQQNDALMQARVETT